MLTKLGLAAAMSVAAAGQTAADAHTNAWTTLVGLTQPIARPIQGQGPEAVLRWQVAFGEGWSNSARLEWREVVVSGRDTPEVFEGFVSLSEVSVVLEELRPEVTVLPRGLPGVAIDQGAAFVVIVTCAAGDCVRSQFWQLETEEIAAAELSDALFGQIPDIARTPTYSFWYLDEASARQAAAALETMIVWAQSAESLLPPLAE